MTEENDTDGGTTMEERQPDWADKHYAFFRNRDCEYFPCHSGVPEEEFNCLFCYCPLYTLGERCGGRFRYSGSGTKICTDCPIPHFRDNYGRIIDRYKELAALAAQKKE